MDLDAELKIWIAGTLLPIQREFNKKVNVYAVQSLLATRVL
jgi:Bacterial PH domain